MRAFFDSDDSAARGLPASSFFSSPSMNLRLVLGDATSAGVAAGEPVRPLQGDEPGLAVRLCSFNAGSTAGGRGDADDAVGDDGIIGFAVNGELTATAGAVVAPLGWQNVGAPVGRTGLRGDAVAGRDGVI